MKLICQGTVLDDSKTLKYYSINENSSITVVKQRPPKDLPAPVNSF